MHSPISCLSPHVYRHIFWCHEGHAVWRTLARTAEGWGSCFGTLSFSLPSTIHDSALQYEICNRIFSEKLLHVDQSMPRLLKLEHNYYCKWAEYARYVMCRRKWYVMCFGESMWTDSGKDMEIQLPYIAAHGIWTVLVTAFICLLVWVHVAMANANKRYDTSNQSHAVCSVADQRSSCCPEEPRRALACTAEGWRCALFGTIVPLPSTIHDSSPQSGNQHGIKISIVEKHS